VATFVSQLAQHLGFEVREEGEVVFCLRRCFGAGSLAVDRGELFEVEAELEVGESVRSFPLGGCFGVVRFELLEVVLFEGDLRCVAGGG